MQADDDELAIFNKLKKEAQEFVNHYVFNYKKGSGIYDYDPVLSHPEVHYRNFLLEEVCACRTVLIQSIIIYSIITTQARSRVL